MLTDFRVSPKTKHPACCDWSCCGNSFGRIEKSFKVNGRILYPSCKIKKMRKTRRYAKHVERQKVKKEIAMEINNE